MQLGGCLWGGWSSVGMDKVESQTTIVAMIDYYVVYGHTVVELYSRVLHHCSCCHITGMYTCIAAWLTTSIHGCLEESEYVRYQHQSYNVQASSVTIFLSMVVITLWMSSTKCAWSFSPVPDAM